MVPKSSQTMHDDPYWDAMFNKYVLLVLLLTYAVVAGIVLIEVIGGIS